jgi:hypothetical protein
MLDEINRVDRLLEVEEHQQGLTYGLTIDHCLRCQRAFIELHCPHTDEFVIQTLEMPIGFRYCSTCRRYLGQSW